MAKLSMNDIVDISINSSGAVSGRNGFNVGLVIVPFPLPDGQRCVEIGSVDELKDLGYSMDELTAFTTAYFAQVPRPRKLVLGGPLNFQITESAIGGTDSKKYTFSNEGIGEILQACRSANKDWYGVSYVIRTKNVTVCSIITTPAVSYQVKDAYLYRELRRNIAPDQMKIISSFQFSFTIADFLSQIETMRACAAYADTMSGISQVTALNLGRSVYFSELTYAETVASRGAMLGRMMGLNTGLPGCAFTLWGKTLSGVAPHEYSADEISTMDDQHVNRYVNRGPYAMLEPGVCADGTPYDELLFLDQLENEIQRNCLDLLTGTKTKIPYTNAGAMQFVAACEEACERAKERGFLEPGVWKGGDTLSLAYGDALPKGYLVQAERVEDRPQTEKALRVCPPIYICANLGGAIQSVKIRVSVT